MRQPVPTIRRLWHWSITWSGALRQYPLTLTRPARGTPLRAKRVQRQPTVDQPERQAVPARAVRAQQGRQQGRQEARQEARQVGRLVDLRAAPVAALRHRALPRRLRQHQHQRLRLRPQHPPALPLSEGLRRERRVARRDSEWRVRRRMTCSRLPRPSTRFASPTVCLPCRSRTSATTAAWKTACSGWRKTRALTR